MKQIAIYLRLSLSDSDLGEDGKEESNSIENQRLLIRNYLQSHDELVGEVVEYKDDGYTGLNFDRPGFRQMLEDAKTGLIGTIVVKDLSRFGRDYIGVGDYLEQILPSLGIRLIAVNSRYDSEDHGMDVFSIDVSINNMINNMYSKDLSKKLRSSFRTKWNEGQNPSGFVPFGYYVKKGDPEHKIEIDEEAAKTVKLIFEFANQGFSSKQITEKINELQIPTPLIYQVKKGLRPMPKNIRNTEEQLWDTHKVLNIIKTYDYTGARVHGKKETVFIGSNKMKAIPKTEHIVIQNNHPPIVSKEEYLNAQTIINVKKRPQNWNKRGDLFSKKLRCGCCGSILQIVQNYSNLIYCQHSESIGSKSKCNKETMDRGQIISEVIYAIRKNIEELSDLRESLVKHTKTKYLSFEQEIETYNQDLKIVSDDLARYYENYVNGNLERNNFIEIKKDITQRKSNILSKIEKLETEKNSSDKVVFDLTRTVNIGRAFFEKEKMPDETVNTFLKEVLVYSQDKIEIFLTTKDLYERALFEIKQIK